MITFRCARALYWALFALLPFFACTEKNKSASNYTIEGTLANAANKVVYLTDLSFYKQDHPRDSVIATAEGHFTFKGSLKEATFYSIEVKGINTQLEFILENAPVTIRGDADSLWKASVKGSRETDIHAEFIPFTGYYANQESFNAIEARYDSAKKAGDQTAFDRMAREKKALSKKFLSSVLSFVKKYPTSFTSVNTISYFVIDDLDEADSLTHSFESGEMKSNPQVVYFRKLIDKKKSLLPGKVAPDFKQADSSGEIINLRDFRNNYVLIDFWASWCGPCRQENRNLVKVFREYGNKGLMIVSVSLDEERGQWLKAIRKDEIGNWTHVSDLKGWNNEVAIQYGIETLPANFLLDTAGKIIGRNLHGEELEKAVASVLR